MDQKNNKSALRRIALIGGGLILANELTRPADGAGRNANVQGLPSGFDLEQFKDLIQADPELRNYLRGPIGPTGSQGVTGSGGADGLAGNMLQNFGGSLIKNGALELGTLENWEGSTNAIIDGIDDRAIKIGTSVSLNLTRVKIVKNRLYRVDAEVKTDQSVLISLQLFQKNSNVFGKNGGTGSSTAWGVTGIVPSYVSKTFYYGGPSPTAANSFDTAYSFRLFIERNNGVTETFLKNLVIRECEIAEPVPFNLPWLPNGQMVFDISDGAVGRYNGTTIDWFSMAV
jgi:hypothetical protein